MQPNDRLQQISAKVRELRQVGGDGRNSRQLIDSLFRDVHSFKAAASAEGLNDLSRTAHQFEDLLHALRSGKVTLDSELLRVFDEIVAALRNGSETSSPERISRLTRQTPTINDELPAEFASLKDEERHRAMAAIREGSNVYLMLAVFEIKNFDERFRQLKEQLQKTAEPISTSARMEDDKIIFQVVYASKSEKIRVQTVIEQAVRAGKSVAAKLGKQVEFMFRADELLLDGRLASELTDALVHLVRNAVDHGIASRGNVILDATLNSEGARIIVTDDGRGVAPENLPLLFQPGFTTATDITELSGRGVGLDAVQANIKQLGGSVSVRSESGKGASFEIRLPNPSSDA